MESMVHLSFRSKTALHSLPEMDPETLPISKMKLFMIVGNDIQSLNIVKKIFAELLNLHMTTKDGTVNIVASFRLLFQRIG